MTRDEILKEYDVDARGIIRSPGKFEGEPVYVPYFWDMFLNGLADDDDGDTLRFYVDDDDRKEFPELAGIDRVSLWEREDGIVMSETA